jgi:hypothetical protein
MNTPNLPEQKESANAGCVQRVVSVRHGNLIFRGCENHPDRSNSSCARIRFEDTNKVLTFEELWQVLQDLEAKHANDQAQTRSR